MILSRKYKFVKPCDMYGGYLTLNFANNLSIFREELADESLERAAAVTTHDVKEGVLHVALYFINIPPYRYSFHEAEHAKNHFMDHVCILNDYNNDEAHAYMIGWIGEFIEECIQKIIKRECQTKPDTSPSDSTAQL